MRSLRVASEPARPGPAHPLAPLLPSAAHCSQRPPLGSPRSRAPPPPRPLPRCPESPPPSLSGQPLTLRPQRPPPQSSLPATFPMAATPAGPLGVRGGHVFPSRQSPGWLFTQEAGVSEPREGRDHGAWVLSHSRARQAGCSDVQVEWMRVTHRSQCVAVVPNSKVSRLSLEPPALTLCPPPRVSHPPL